MSTLDRFINYSFWVLAALLLAGLGGCSSDHANPIATSSNDAAVTAEAPAIAYPAIQEADLAAMLPGFTVARTKPVHGDQVMDQSSRLIRYREGGTVTHRNCGVQIGPWQLRSDQTVAVSTPVPGTAVVDYYPHPYLFNGCIRIWIDLNTIQLPAGHRWDELAFFYQESDGTLTRYWGVIDLHTMTYSAWPNHFSRYIIGFPAR